MLIIDIKNKQVKDSPHFDTDVVVLRGASQELVNSLTNLVSTKQRGITPSVSKKIPLASSRIPERVSSSLKGTVFGGDQYNEVYSKLSGIVEQASKPARSYRTNTTAKIDKKFYASKATRKALQTRLATLLTSNPSYVEQLRLAVQGHSYLNPNASTVTARNIKAAIALYAYYSHDSGFSSPEGCATISKTVQISQDTLIRLASEVNLLHKTGHSNSTRYFVDWKFGQLLIRSLQNNRHLTSLLHNVDSVQNQLDTLGSLSNR